MKQLKLYLEDKNYTINTLYFIPHVKRETEIQKIIHSVSIKWLECVRQCDYLINNNKKNLVQCTCDCDLGILSYMK